MPTIKTIAESLYWCYANLAMAHAAVESNSATYIRTHFIIRSRLYSGLITAKMSLGSIVDDERLKMTMPQACNYCGSHDKLSIDHLISKAKGDFDKADNMVWACRNCNSSKGDTDLLDWYKSKEVFPPLLLLRRYLKIVVEYCRENELLDKEITEPLSLPFSLAAIPHNFPKPSELRLWVVSLDL
jgi:hypothetical protein